MDTEELRVLCYLMMVSDPWPLEQEDLEIFEAMLNRAAANDGFLDWLDAYHKL